MPATPQLPVTRWAGPSAHSRAWRRVERRQGRLQWHGPGAQPPVGPRSSRPCTGSSQAPGSGRNPRPERTRPAAEWHVGASSGPPPRPLSALTLPCPVMTWGSRRALLAAGVPSSLDGAAPPGAPTPSQPPTLPSEVWGPRWSCRSRCAAGGVSDGYQPGTVSRAWSDTDPLLGETRALSANPRSCSGRRYAGAGGAGHACPSRVPSLGWPAEEVARPRFSRGQGRGVRWAGQLQSGPPRLLPCPQQHRAGPQGGGGRDGHAG